MLCEIKAPGGNDAIIPARHGEALFAEATHITDLKGPESVARWNIEADTPTPAPIPQPQREAL